MARPQTIHPLPTKERLDELVEYDAETGALVWRSREPSSFLAATSIEARRAASRWETMNAGKPAGRICKQSGYMRMTIDNVHHMCHRVAWKVATGEEPVNTDHINGDKLDNRLINLRSVTHQVNAKNRKMYVNNKSGVNGVSFHKRDKTWNARISIGSGIDVHLGSYDTIEEATIARAAAQTLLDYHDNHGLSIRK